MNRIDMGDPNWKWHPYEFNGCEVFQKIKTSIDGYSSKNLLIDRDFSTGWMIAANQQIEISLNWSDFCRSFVLINGYNQVNPKNQKYRRIKTMGIYINNKLIGIGKLEDTDKLQQINLFEDSYDVVSLETQQHVELNEAFVLKLKVLDIYAGEENKLLINEIILIE
jgi:hypothetical protein